VNLRMGSDLKRLGGADLAYPIVGKNRELAVLNAVIITINVIRPCAYAPFPNVYTVL